ncbi:uncharacterized protein I206_100247 [Kwoniella pini CBS 10737]|uniref:Uncharacterized protein n=1 Tax=Kwoniella pini CBS 10737 TaxID=1296096 RepID=A0A1B9IEB5_9TREE|nr:uncharacterized protein I206_01078 [Kwoniella pini CBS 10737]OCF53771.1 hypothetical protein I206_01078 [Kwoniella pini CBS 10737]
MTSAAKPLSLSSRSSSQLSLDSHLSSPRKRYDNTPSRPSLHKNGTKPPSAIYLGEASSAITTDNRNSGEVHHHQGEDPPSPHLRMSSGFASVNVGIGSPKLDFGRRDWPGNSYRRKEGSSTENSPEVVQDGQVQQQPSYGLVDKVSGLPSPPGTESDIAAPMNGKLSTTVPQRRSSPVKASLSTSKSPPKSFRRTSSTGSAQVQTHRSTSHSDSSTHVPDSPRFRTSALRPKHSPSLSMSRSGSSSSSLITSPSMVADKSINGSSSIRRGSAGMSRTSSHSSNLSMSGKSNLSLSPRKPSPLDVKRANSPEERISSPERTAKRLPPVSAGIENLNGKRHSRRASRDLREEVLEEEPNIGSSNMSRSKSQGSELDDKIREAEERIAQAALERKRRSVDVDKSSTPSRHPIRRHDSYTRITGSPLAASTSSGLRRSTPLSSVQAEVPSEISSRVDEPFDTPDKGDKDRERSGGSSSSRKRKGLPAEFRSSSSLFTPSPQKPKSSVPDDQPGSSRSARLRQFIDSPSDYQSASPIPSRFSSNSRRSGEFEIIPSPIRALRHIEGLERSSSLSVAREVISGYSRPNWSQSISGLPRADEETDYRGLPRDRYRSETVLGGSHDRSYQSRIGEGRRGNSTLVSERDLMAASRSRSGALGPGDSVSAVGGRSERAEAKDPLEMIRRLEEQRAESKRRWDHMPRPATSMSSMRDAYNNPPNSAPLDGLRHRRSLDQNSPLSPSFARGGASRLSLRATGGPSTEPRTMRSRTSLGGRSSTIFELANASTEHGRLLFEAFRVLESKLGQEISACDPDLLRTFHSATRTSENINKTLRHALQLASQIAIDAELEDPIRVKEKYSDLASLLKEAGKASEQNVRDMTRIMLDLPKLIRTQDSSVKDGRNGMTSSTSAELSTSRLRRSESAMLKYDPVKPTGVMSQDRPARRWQPASPVNHIDKSPLQSRWSTDTPRRSHDILRSSTSIGDNYSPLSRYSSLRNSQRADGDGRGESSSGINENGGTRANSTVSSLMSKVRSMTPRKSLATPSKLDLSTIEQSPPAPRYSPTKSSSPEREKPQRNLLKKKVSSLSTNTVKGISSNFLPTTAGVKPTTAISQITAGDSSPTKDSIQNPKGILDGNEPNSPMSRFSFNSQKQRKLSISRQPQSKSHSRNGSGESGDNFTIGSYTTSESGEYRQSQHQQNDAGQIEDEEDGEDAVTHLAQNLAQVAKIRDDRGFGGALKDEREREDPKRPSLSDRFRASLRKSSRVE